MIHIVSAQLTRTASFCGPVPFLTGAALINFFACCYLGSITKSYFHKSNKDYNEQMQTLYQSFLQNAPSAAPPTQQREVTMKSAHLSYMPWHEMDFSTQFRNNDGQEMNEQQGQIFDKACRLRETFSEFQNRYKPMLGRAVMVTIAIYTIAMSLIASRFVFQGNFPNKDVVILLSGVLSGYLPSAVGLFSFVRYC